MGKKAARNGRPESQDGRDAPGGNRDSRLDAAVSAAARAPRLAGRGLIKLYRYTLSGFVGFHCRHLPTCSDYADEALARHGLWAGGWITLARLLRCHPFGSSGIDPPPQVLPGDSRWYLPWRYGRWTGRHIAERWDGKPMS